ncbi:hypothetical protein I3842_06G147200 [Carya illinoinensis]|uniref:Uncharacterized protein n=1 Tax=Carya illinoinensis TaxID=32201 RepID=A0A922EX03_CARIL|nr:hypothetical protein I3842_06G147200 [Carya illinoinensis]
MNLNECEMPKYLDEGLRSMPFKPNFSRPKQRVLTQQRSPNWRGQAKISQQPKRRQHPEQFQKKGGSVNGGRATRTNSWIQIQQQLVDPIENYYKNEAARAQARRDLLNSIVDYRKSVDSIPPKDQEAV